MTQNTETTGTPETTPQKAANVDTSFFEGLKNQSGKIDKLATSLAKAQGEITGARKTSKNPFFKSDYADLYECIEATRPALSKNGLAIVQTNDGVHVIGNTVFLHVGTMLMHTSGQWIRSYVPIPIDTPINAHKLGSALTYGRRYGLSAMIGIAQMDDDGNAATQGTTTMPDKVAPHRRKPVQTGTKVAPVKVEPLVQPANVTTGNETHIPIDGGLV